VSVRHALEAVPLAGPTFVSFGDGDGVSTTLVVAVVVVLVLSPLLLGLALRLADRRRDRRGPREDGRAGDGPASRNPFSAWPLPLRVAALVCAAAAGWVLAALVG
jgi:hypothetical protein